MGSKQMASGFTSYKPIAEVKAKLRLYLNDPAIQKHIKKLAGMGLEYPIPITFDGKMVVGKTKDGKFHWFFAHENSNFIPVFVDLDRQAFEDARLKSKTQGRGESVSSKAGELLTEGQLIVLKEYLQDYKDEIEQDVEDFGRLQPLLPLVGH